MANEVRGARGLVFVGHGHADVLRQRLSAVGLPRTRTCAQRPSRMDVRARRLLGCEDRGHHQHPVGQPDFGHQLGDLHDRRQRRRFSSVITECAKPWWASNCNGAIDSAQAYINNTLPGRLDLVNNDQVPVTDREGDRAGLSPPLQRRGLQRRHVVQPERGDAAQPDGRPAADRIRAAATRAGANFLFRDVIPPFIGHAVATAAADRPRSGSTGSRTRGGELPPEDDRPCERVLPGRERSHRLKRFGHVGSPPRGSPRLGWRRGCGARRCGR